MHGDLWTLLFLPPEIRAVSLLIKLNLEQYQSHGSYSAHFIHTNEDELLKLVVWIIYSVVGGKYIEHRDSAPLLTLHTVLLDLYWSANK